MQINSLRIFSLLVWDPYLKQDIERQAVRCITGDYRTREEGLCY